MDQCLGIATSPTASTDPRAPVHVLISHSEINDQHGTGPLMMRTFRERGTFSIRSRDDWKIHDFGDWHVRLTLEASTRTEIDASIRRLLYRRNIQSVSCVPFTAAELLAAIAVKDRFGVKLAVWIMDDQNIAVHNIPDEIMRECLEKCSLRLMTHPELRSAYEEKFGLPAYILPAVVPGNLVCNAETESRWDGQAKTGAILGSFWDQSWFDRLSSVLEECEGTYDWYGQNNSPWLKYSPEALNRARINPLGILPENRLAKELNQYPFVIVPVGSLDGADQNTGTAYLSLPGRIIFAAAASRAPILIVGSERSCGAHFVQHFGIGAVAPYDAGAVARAMEYLRTYEAQKECRANAASVGRMFSADGVAEWLGASTQLGEPADMRFESAFDGYNSVWTRP
jgi:hypothetical protein